MDKNFIKKNLVTILMVTATVVLAGVAIFTAMRLYQLRSQPVSPNVPASTPGAQESPVGVRPKSGNWNQPESFVITNNSSETVNLVWFLDCWDETICEDSRDEVTLEPGDSIEEGLGVICSRWQLDLNWTGTATDQNDVWDWGAVAEVGSECEESEETGVGGPSATIEPSTPQSHGNENITFETTSCSALAFTLTTATPTTTATATPTTTATATPTTTATATPTTTATATPKTYSCNTSCTTDAQCRTANSNYVCHSATSTCRHINWPGEQDCQAPATSTASPTPSSTSTATPKPSTTSTAIAQGSTPTASPATLPDAGVAAPTIVGIGAGIILLMGAMILAL